MTYDLVCEFCGKKYQATRRTSKTCSVECRVARSKGKPKPSESAQDAGESPEIPIGLTASTLTELVKAGRENSPAGQAALLLAYRIERSAGDTGSSVAALVKQHAATLADALKSAEKASVVDKLRKSRDAKRAG